MLASEIVNLMESTFSNVERLKEERFPSFRVKDKYGNDAGTISNVAANEWHIFVDNFPSPKRYFSTNLPVDSMEQFESDMERTGLVLKRLEARSATAG